jgi:hypothetical protein
MSTTCCHIAEDSNLQGKFVFLFQKLKDDDISKFALCSAKMPGEIIADVSVFVVL